ncbi:conserved hypothetical protein [Thermocrinis albus DSM 14484]|uniref:PA2779 family protein n=1 Tax=Thermocrinis albus (strain DSM 14484 / JCM 11386 / HI 11/12) TaxID=638303 RepID=D3SPR4_THEAH|nr:PA2779 family protein [Thermocrinis albus]ADC89151.1 conserved hypothetical protein [Thermocrinis albus DSM 14484]
MMKFFRNRLLILGVAGWFLAFNTAPALAGLVESKPANQQLESSREENIRTIQRALESKIVQEKLKAYGLTKEEVEKKLKEMDDQQIHMLAQASQKVLAGGDGLGVVIAVLVIAILVVILLKLLNKEIIIR